MTKLKPCPFCGENLTAIARSYNVYRICVACGARGPEASTIEEANRLWNNRGGEN